MSWQRPITGVVLFFGLLVVVAYSQNCGKSGRIDFESVAKKALLSESNAGNGESYDGKPENGRYCRVFPDLKCGESSSTLQGLVNVTGSGIILKKDNCTIDSLNINFSSPLLSYSAYNPSFIGYSHGIFERCEEEIESLPDENNYQASAATEIWCHSDAEQFDAIVKHDLNKNSYTAQAFFEVGSEHKIVPAFGVTKLSSQEFLTFKGIEQNFQLAVETSSNLGFSKAVADAKVDDQVKHIELVCRISNPSKVTLIERDVEIHPSWIDTTNLVGYWKLNGIPGILPNGSSIIDEVTGLAGMTYDNVAGVSPGTMSRTTGKVREGIHLDGNDDYVDSGIMQTLPEISISAWINLDRFKFSSPFLGIVSKWTNGTGTTIPLQLTVGRSTNDEFYINFRKAHYGGTGEWRSPFGSFQYAYLGNWHHIALTYDGRSVLNVPSIYIDGVNQNIQVVRSPAGAPYYDSTDSFIFGSIDRTPVDLNGHEQFFPGSLDEISIWNRPLTAKEVQDIYQRGSSSF